MLRLALPRTALLRRAFTTSASPREHFLNATPAIFESIVTNGDDRVVLVDFFAELVPFLFTCTPRLTTRGAVDGAVRSKQLLSSLTHSHTTAGPCKVLTPVLKSVISPNKTLGGADRSSLRNIDLSFVHLANRSLPPHSHDNRHGRPLRTRGQVQDRLPPHRRRLPQRKASRQIRRLSHGERRARLSHQSPRQVALIMMMTNAMQ